MWTSVIPVNQIQSFNDLVKQPANSLTVFYEFIATLQMLYLTCENPTTHSAAI
jgi:hypothetical protein